MFARLITGEHRLEHEYEALRLCAGIRDRQNRPLEAIELAEQTYILVSKAHGPGHPQVQGAASQLIQSLIQSGDYSRADDYARMNYENLTDPSNRIDQKGQAVADGMRQIAAIWIKKAPVDDEVTALALAEEAEDMARKSCDISDAHSSNMVGRYTVFGEILLRRMKYTDETRIVLERGAALFRMRPIAALDEHRRWFLYKFVHFHDHVSESMPPGDARDREFKLRDAYRQEIAVLGLK